MKSYLQLFLTSIKAKNIFADKSVAVAFTSTESKEGVSYVVNSFASELATRTRQRILIADAEELLKAQIFHKNQIADHCQRINLGNLYLLESDGKFSSGKSNGDQQLRVKSKSNGDRQLQVKSQFPKLEQGLNNLQILRKTFDFILIDSPALNISDEATLFASAIEGVVLVVEANHTRREQVRNSIKTIKRASGNLIGCVMNKRRYSIPNWLYRRI
jgi:hypothetical protein